MFSNEQLTSPDFDEVAYLRYALRVSNFTTEHARLEHCIAEVKSGMESILADHADELIDQARCTHKAQREVSGVRQSTDSLQKAAGRLRLMIEEPYQQLQSRVRELEASQEAVQLLQSTLSFLSLTSRLQEQLASAPSLDIIRASYTLREVEEVLQEDALRSLQVVDAQLPAVERYAAAVRSKAHDLLAMAELTSPPKANSSNSGAVVSARDGSTSRVAANVSTGLQCAYVLRMLSRTVQGFMTERRREVLRTVMRELDAQAIEEHISAEYERLCHAHPSNGGVGGGGGVSEQAVIAHVTLEHIQKTLFVAVQHTQCVILLWRLLLQKRDAQTQAPYLAAIESPMQLLVEYWATITERLRERLNSLQKRNSIRLALASAYPRYHHLIASFLSRIDAASATEAPMSGGSAAAGVASAAALVSSIYVAQCGMGDFLDLVDMVDVAVRRGGSADGTAGDLSLTNSPAKPTSQHAAPRTDTHDLRHTWAAQVTDDVRDGFRAYVMDRHRELVGGVLARLSTTLPASAALGGQPAAVAPVRMQGSRRPPIPPQANALDLAAYTRMVTQEVQMFRQDPHTLNVLLDCAVASLRQLRSKFTDAVRRFPLPPLPAVTAAPTLVQVLHLCIANGCTTLAYDCTAVLACVPQMAPWSGGTTADGAGQGHAGHTDPLAGALELLSGKRVELQRLIHDFHEMAERSSRPFAESAQAVLLPTLTQATDNVLRAELATAAAAGKGRAMMTAAAAAAGAGGDSRTALAQLQLQCRHFTDRFFFLVDARTSGWMEACQHMTDTLLARLLTRVVTTPPPPQLQGAVSAVAPAFARVLQVVMPAVLQYAQVIQSAGAVGRATSLLRGCVRQVEGFYEACGVFGKEGARPALRAALVERLRPPVPAFFARLIVVQYGLFVSSGASAPPSSGLMMAAAMGVSEQAAMKGVEEALLTEMAAAGTPSTPTAGAGDLREGVNTVEAAVEVCYTRLAAGVPAPAAAQLQELWSSTVCKS